MDSIPSYIRDQYARDFAAADASFYDGRVEATTKNQATHWQNWCSYVGPLGVDPYLQNVHYQKRARLLTGFAARVRAGRFGNRGTVKGDTVATALSAVGTEISMVCGVKPLKVMGSNNYIPRVDQTLAGWRKVDDPVKKKLPIEVDVPEWLVRNAMAPGTPELAKAVADLILVAFYFLLRVGEYTFRQGKQTVEFRAKDCTFFKKYNGRLQQMPREALDEEILAADSSTLKLDNQKNGWHGVCINHEHNGDAIFCPVRALGRRYIHLRKYGGINYQELPLSMVFSDGKTVNVTDKDIRVALKTAGVALDYLARGIPIERIDTHSCRCGGANALSLAYSDRHIQKLGRWRGATFKEYIKEQLCCFSLGMSRSMKRMFNFVNMEGGANYDVTETVVGMAYQVNVSA